ncbi:DinB family protein [Mucilaginibacter ginkgonis]|uniref:DinB family protein n=1 Tax=Mucilaginibacter ginkgonis TaxID=2682091 RepID=A0A7T7FDW6_9SPHI|nr:DinB family protein [Mucilaginibacter ginkgonis]
MAQPEPGEYAPYASGYIALASEYNDIRKLLTELKDITYSTFTAIPEEKGNYTYADGKWTIKQKLAHMIDAERVFAYRAYCIALGDKTAFPGFEQDDYVANANSRTLKNIADEFRAVREANLYFINNLSDEQSTIVGTSSNHSTSVRAILYIMAGHELHHLKLLKERYL